MKRFLILILLTTTLFSLSSQPYNPQDEKRLFEEILERFSIIDNKIAQLGSENNNTPPRTLNEIKELFASQFKLIKEYKPIIEDSKNISDRFLDEIHPKMKTMFRDSLVGSYTMSIDIISEFNMIDSKKDGLSNKFLTDLSAKNAKISKMRYSFFNFISQNSGSFNKLEMEAKVYERSKSEGNNKGFLGYVMIFIAFVVSGIFGAFAWSAILLPIFVVIPRSIRRRRKFPFSTLVSIAIWSLVLYFGTKYFLEWQPNLFWGVIVGLGLSALNITKKAFFGGQDLEHDIKDTYGEDLSNVN